MANIFHELGKVVNEKISGLLDTLRSSANNWTGVNTFLKDLNLGSDASVDKINLNVGTTDTPQDINVFGAIKVDGSQNLGNLDDFVVALGEVANNGMASQIANLEARLHKLRTFYPDARPARGSEIGEMIFDLEKSVILVWNGIEWLELAGKVPVVLKLFSDGQGTVSGAGTYNKGEDVYITAIPRPNYAFKEWTGDGVLAGMVASPTSESTFVNMAQSWVITAKFGLEEHLLLVTVTGGGSVEGNNTYWEHGSKATIKAIVGPNSNFIQWNGGVDDPFSLETTITMTGPKEVEAVFSLKSYLLTLLADGGTATTTSGVFTFEHGQQAEVEATADSIHDFSKWSGDGILSDPYQRIATIEMTEPRIITAEFSLKQYQLTVQAGAGGTANGTGVFEHFSNAPITATPDDANGYEFDSWTGDVSAPSSEGTTVYISGETIVVANFKLKQYLVSTEAFDQSNSTAGGGTVSGGGQTIEHGSNVDLLATPDSIYDFVNWTGVNLADPTNPSQSVPVTSEVTIVANFRYKQYILTVLAGTGGNATGSGTYSHFDEVDIVATADDTAGYEFDSWSTDSGVLASTSTEATKITISGTHTVTANFKLKDYALSLESFDLSNSIAGGGTTSGGGVKQHGEVVTITATPDPEYDFASWEDTTGNPVGTDPTNSTNTYTMSGPFTIVANFKYKQYALTVSAGVEGTTSGTGIFSHFDEASITATPGPTPDGEDGYEFDSWSIVSGSSTIDDQSSDAAKVTVLGVSEVIANFKLKDYVVVTGAKFKGKISIGGYYPLYATANEANADPDGDGTNHAHEINGVTYFMPNGLTTFYHGTHTIPWGDLSLYDEENPGDPTTGTGPWGTTPVTKQHGTDGWYIATPAQYHVFDVIEADSRWTLPWLDEYSEVGPVQIRESLNFVANFSLLQYSLNIMHYPTSEWLPNSLSGASAYWGDIEINGDNANGGSGSGSQEEFPGLIADGVWTTANVSQLYWSGYFDAFSQQTIKAIPKTADGYGFIEWVEPAGQSLVADREAAETTVTITPEGTNTGNQVELAARFGKLPISTFLTSGDLYFGETINFTDVSTAPSGDGTVVSATYTNDQGISFGNRDTALRQFNQHYTTASQIKVTTPFDYMDYSKAWSIMVKAKNITGPGAIYSHRGLNYIFTPSQTNNQAFYCYRDGASIYQDQNFDGPWDDWIIQCSGSQLTFWGKKSDGTVRKIGPGGSTASIASPNSSDPLILLNGEIGAGTPQRCYQGVVRDIGFMQSTLTQEQVDEFFEQELPDLSYYNSLHDHIACGSKPYPSLNGEKGNIVAVLERGTETQFKSLASLTLPAGSPRDTTRSIDVTLTVTDDQGLTDTETQTITCGPAPLVQPELDSYEKFVQTADGLYILGSPGVLSVETEITDGGVTLTEKYL